MKTIVALVGRTLQRVSVTDALVEAGAERNEYADTRDAVVTIGSARSERPACILVDGEQTSAAQEIADLRGDPAVATIPVIALVRYATESAYKRLFFAGADDVLPRSDELGICNRVQRLQAALAAQREPVNRGDALVLHPDPARRRIIGRTFQRAGFNVIFGHDPKEFAELTGGRAITVALISDEVPGGAFAAIAALRQQLLGLLVPGIVLSREDEPEIPEDVRSRLPMVAVESDQSPPDNLLFLTNELMSPSGNDLRRSARILYSSLCSFRVGGQFTSAFGFSYNISREGLYVRSLAPPARGTSAWIELCPPLSSEVVHLRAKVVWASEGPHTGMAPNGFAAEIDPIECPANDLNLYRQGYDAFAP